MSLTPGSRLGPYEIQAAIGAGGMGEVYRALDTRLDRLVAVKILPAHLATDATAIARFQRETRAVAALSHPNILAIHDVGAEGTTSYAVMELLDGETLRQRLSAGPLPVRKAVEFAVQISRALAAAHGRRIVHRDLKPENIFVARDGHVKVLDFGLAKSQDTEGSAPEATVAADTTPGAVLGTVGYMSPEQVRGVAADDRSDIFSLGVVLYEMLSGRRAFARDTAAETMTAILKEDPPELASGATQVPTSIERIVRRCLEKHPGERFHSAHDLGLALETITFDSATLSQTAPIDRAPRRGGSLVPWTVAALATLVAAWAGWYAWSSSPPAAPAPRRLMVVLPADSSVWLGRGSSVALSPQGTLLAYVAATGDVTRLYLRALDRFESTLLPGTEGAANPFFSPNGQWIGFTADGKLRKVAVDGGRAITICDARNLRGEAWGADDGILFTPNGATGLWRVAAAGGTPERVTEPGEGELSHRWPQFMPDGRSVLYTIWNDAGFDAARLAVATPGSRDQRVLVQGGGYGRIAPIDDRRGYVVYARAEGLMAAPVDLRPLSLAGPATPVVDGVVTNLSGGAHYSISANGTLAYVPGNLTEIDKVLVAVDRSGQEQAVARISGLSLFYRLSPDGRFLARVNTDGGDRDVWIDDLQRGTATRLTFGGHHFDPVWTPDGQRVIYAAGLPGSNLYWKPVDGTGGAQRLTTTPHAQRPESVSPDGRTLAFVEFDPVRTADIWTLALDATRPPRPFLQTPFSEGNPTISPDGRWMAFQSNESGRFEVYVSPFPDGGAKFQVSASGGFDPLWSRDGRDLFYRFDDRMFAVRIEPTPQLTTGPPRVLFRGAYQGVGDVTPEGRLLLIKPTEQEAAPRSIAVVLNWFTELAAKVPLK